MGTTRTATNTARPEQRTRVARVARGARAVQSPPLPDTAAEDPPQMFTLNRAREELGLPFAEFELALQLGEIGTVVGGGADRPRVSATELARVRDQDGGTAALLSRIELVNTTAAADLLGVGRDRLLRLTRAGYVRPVRWYVNRYRALVWLYLAGELREFAVARPALLTGRLPAELREAEAEGADLRPRGWRSRQVARLVEDAPGPWEEAAVWAALLGPELTDEAVPDPHERRRLRGIRTVLPYGRPGPLAGMALIRRLTLADAPDEVAAALLALAEALGRARAGEKVPPKPPYEPWGAPPPEPGGAPPTGDVPAPRRVRPPVAAPDAVRALPASGGALAGPGSVAARGHGTPPTGAGAWVVGERPRRSLLRLLRGRRRAVDG
ncbi:DUF6397 family protein [Streptomyces sp. NPDC021020]|uniref:DUF6397 family protein n=1 Tax=Streptomyces sp. NPDC021020 TaxID=3365109 RepID=UPI003788B254